VCITLEDYKGNLQEYLQNCSNDILKHLFLEVSMWERKGYLRDGMIRNLESEGLNFLDIISKIKSEISKRWYIIMLKNNKLTIIK